jgi:hypothetical protein
MPSPINVVLKDLLKGEKLSHEQMIGIVQSRAEIVARCFDTFVLQTLEQLACLDSGNGLCHDLRKDNPTITDESGMLANRRQGIFAGTPLARKAATGDVYKTFGFSRSKEWLFIEINFCLEANGYEKATFVKVVKSDLPTLLFETGIDPQSIFMLFRIVIDNWVVTRKHSYESICKIAQGIDIDDCMLLLIRS